MPPRKNQQYSSLSFNVKDTLGVGKDNFPTTVLTPPPKYPPLSSKPAPLVLSSDQEYMLAVGKELMRSLRAFQPKDILWSSIPEELTNSKGKKRIGGSRGPGTKKKKKVAMSSLDALEALEEKDGDDPEEDEEGKKGRKNDDEEEEDGEGRNSGDDEDEELDEGTDYANNYFDNGEDYGEDEDDNLDEGGIY